MALAKAKPLYPEPADIEDDFYSWCYEQAQLLRLRRFAESDLPNVIEELEGMARNHRSALKSSYRLVILHLLKWQYQPARRARSQAAKETRLPVSTFPADCPYTVEQLRDFDWMPE